jgi:hypothetical protein
VLLTIAFVQATQGAANAMTITHRLVERTVNWTTPLGPGEVGIAEETDVLAVWSSWDEESRRVLAVRTTVFYGFGSVSIPCCFIVFAVMFGAVVVSGVILATLPVIHRRYGAKYCSIVHQNRNQKSGDVAGLLSRDFELRS